MRLHDRLRRRPDRTTSRSLPAGGQAQPWRGDRSRDPPGRDERSWDGSLRSTDVAEGPDPGRRAGRHGAYAVGASGLADSALGARKVQVGGTTLNWLTWSDHYFTNQVQKVKNSTKIGAHIQLISDDADAYTRVKQGGSQWDMSSEDALWVPLFYKQGLIQALDLSELPVSKQLYSVARQVPFWKAGSNQMGYPFGWSSLQVYYNPKLRPSPTRGTR